MSAMPERVWVCLNESTGEPKQVATSMFYAPSGRITQAAYVPESRLLAAEARVREVDGICDILAQEINRASDHVANSDALYRKAAAERDALKSRLKDLEDTLDTYWVNNVNKLKENLKEMEAERQKWINHAIHVESTLRKEIDVLRTQLENRNA